jgi:hypothetical protein
MMSRLDGLAHRASIVGISSLGGALGAGVAAAVLAVEYDHAGLEEIGVWWVAPATLVVGAAVGATLPALRRMVAIAGAAPMAIVSALVATFLCVPETDQFRFAVVIPVGVLVVEVLLRRQIGVHWYGLAAASIAWAGLYGGTERNSAVIGALFAWWAVLLAPLVALVRPVAVPAVATLVAAVGSVAAVVMARTGGISDSGEFAIVAAVVIGVVSYALGLVIARSGPGWWEQRRRRNVTARPSDPER